MKNWGRILTMFVLLLMLILVYLFQHFNYLGALISVIGIDSEEVHAYSFFIFNKSVRFFLNDTIMVFFIWTLFREVKYVKLAVVIELFGLLILLPVYFVLKLLFEGDSEISSPLLSFIHRLIVNPTLMILLIPGIYLSKQSNMG